MDNSNMPCAKKTLCKLTYTKPSSFSQDVNAFNVRDYGTFSVATVSDGNGLVFDVRKIPNGNAIVMENNSPILYAPFYGQSNVFEGGSLGVAFGAEAYPHAAVTYAHSPRAGGNVLADETEFRDLRALTDGPRAAQTLATMAGFAYEYLHRNQKAQTSTGFFAFTSWHGGQTIDKFAKGTNNYENVIIGARKARGVASRYDRAVDCKFITYVQGESATTNYEADAVALSQDLIADVASAMQLSSDPKFVILQINNADNVVAASGVEQQQFLAARNNDSIVLAGPMYNAPFQAGSDEIHQGFIGRMVLGEVLAVCYISINETGSFRPFEPETVKLSGTTITVTYTDTGEGLQLDTDWVLPVAYYGFQLSGRQNPVSITSINIVSDRVLEIELSTTPVGDTLRLDYAIKSDGVNDEWAGGRGQIYSSSGYNSYYHSLGYIVPQDIRHYSPRFSMLVEQ